MTNPILQFLNVDFSYGDAPVLKGVNFSVSQGEFVGVIGPNGGGKTTCLKLAMGFLDPQCGKIDLFGDLPKHGRCQVGYVPQGVEYDKQFPITVLELVLTGAVSKVRWWGTIPKEIKEKALDALKKVGLLELANRPFGSLSGGQAQKALIARAILGQPKILLLDEPTANIDPKAEEQIFGLLQELKASMTIVIVTHNFDAIMKNVERVLCFQQTVTSILPKDVCEHFAIGMYHKTGGDHG